MWYIVCFIAGVFFGALAVCMCVVAGDADRGKDDQKETEAQDQKAKKEN